MQGRVSTASIPDRSFLHLVLPFVQDLWNREDSHFIETGYRPPSGSIRKSFESWGDLHNESVNIYSHLIGSLLFAALPIYIFRTEIPPRYKVATSTDIGACSIYFIGVAICFLLSATFHKIMNHSPKMDKLGMQLDFQGVILLMWGATVPLIYYGFYCDKTLQWVYWSLLSAFAILCSIFTFQPRFSDPFLRPLRAATFGSLAFLSIIPMIHGIIKYGWALQSQRMDLKWVLVTLGLNTLGAAAYAIKFPERWFKKTFDIFGASHQWLHIMVILAGLAHTVGVLHVFDLLHAHPTECVIL
ncbi:hemolysin-III channel protein-like protein Izh2 [Stipitochalara longipes BDJ]|nr:hemolysin-III channel protein-like protein Izh2 [Stipitochalara longipes BDJ]